jgi:hypothetical protein
MRTEVGKTPTKPYPWHALTLPLARADTARHPVSSSGYPRYSGGIERATET